FHDDTRYLSQFVLTVDGQKLDSLTAGNINYFSAAFYLTNHDMPGLKPRSISVRRARFVGDGLTEDIWIKNHLDKRIRITVRLHCAIDFADLFEVKSMDVEKQGTLRIKPDEKGARLSYDYANGTFRARAQIRSSAPTNVTDDGFLYDLSLEPREEWETQIQILVHQNDEFLEPKHRAFADPEKEGELLFKKWRDDVPRIRASWDLLHHVYRKSIVDLAALRLRADFGADEYWLPAAGLPWFMAIFGRDTIITSYQSLWVGPELVRGALHALAE